MKRLILFLALALGFAYCSSDNEVIATPVEQTNYPVTDSTLLPTSYKLSVITNSLPLEHYVFKTKHKNEAWRTQTMTTEGITIMQGDSLHVETDMFNTGEATQLTYQVNNFQDGFNTRNFTRQVIAVDKNIDNKHKLVFQQFYK